ncbi:hypothetical protein Tco_0275358, partial [Tanacetum coccineum]
MSPDLKGKHNRTQFQIIGGVILLMNLEQVHHTTYPSKFEVHSPALHPNQGLTFLSQYSKRLSYLRKVLNEST